MDAPLMITVKQAAELANVGRSTAYHLTQSGEWPTVRIGRAVRIPVRKLEEWIERQTVQASP